MKRIVLISVISLFFNLFSLFGCRHEWVDATCTAPKTCIKCEEAEGEPLGHSWKGPTCVEPKTCTVCNVTEGNPVMHNWKPATCEEPKTCADCQATEGEPNGHTYPADDFATVFCGYTIEETDLGNAYFVRRCTVCNKEESQSIYLGLGGDTHTLVTTEEGFLVSFKNLPAEPSSAISKGAFTFTAQEFTEALNTHVPSGSSAANFIDADNSFNAVAVPFIADSTTTMDDIRSAPVYIKFFTSCESSFHIDNNASNSTFLSYEQPDAPIVAMLIAMQKYDDESVLCNNILMNALGLCSQIDADLAFYTISTMTEFIQKTSICQAYYTLGDSGNIAVNALDAQNGFLFYFISVV